MRGPPHVSRPPPPPAPQVQKLMRAAREGTKDGLQRTKAAVKRGRSFMRTKPFVSQGLWPQAAGQQGPAKWGSGLPEVEGAGGAGGRPRGHGRQGAK